MSASTECLADEASYIHPLPAQHAEPLVSMSLRGGLEISAVRPGDVQRVMLAGGGTHFVVSVSGKPIIGSDGEDRSRFICKPHALHILRQPAGAPQRWIDVGASACLAVLVYFPQAWCIGCPRGATCQVSRFLMGGAGDAPPGDGEIALDTRSLSYARALLDLRIEDDAAILAAEQLVLALLAWTYAKHTGPQISEAGDSSVPPKALSKLKQAADILSQRLDDPPTISELSAIVGMNACDLKRCFKCCYGDGIARFSRSRRLEAAQDLLSRSTLSIAEIALEVGYTNPSQFARAFRQQFNINPAEYRRLPRPNAD